MTGWDSCLVMWHCHYDCRRAWSTKLAAGASCCGCSAVLAIALGHAVATACVAGVPGQLWAGHIVCMFLTLFSADYVLAPLLFCRFQITLCNATSHTVLVSASRDCTFATTTTPCHHTSPGRHAPASWPLACLPSQCTLPQGCL